MLGFGLVCGASGLRLFFLEDLILDDSLGASSWGTESEGKPGTSGVATGETGAGGGEAGIPEADGRGAGATGEDGKPATGGGAAPKAGAGGTPGEG